MCIKKICSIKKYFIKAIEASSKHKGELEEFETVMDRMHKWQPKKYLLFMCYLASLASFAWTKYKKNVA